MAILFCDFNGTIINDTPIWRKAMQETFLAFGKEPPTIAKYFQEMESGDYSEVYQKHGINASPEELNAIYEPAYEEEIHSVNLFPHVKETLRQLKESGVCLILITTQIESLVTPLLDKFGINAFFESHAFDVLNKKIIIIEKIKERDADPSKCYLVGDSPSDVRRAKEAGIIAIAFLTGFIPNDLLIAARADYYISNFGEIIKLIKPS